MKRVVHLSTAHRLGDTRLFIKECRSLARAGYDVTLVTPHERDEVVDGVKIKGIHRASRRLERMTLTQAQVLREAVRLNADLYHFHMVELIPVGLFLRARGKTVVYDIYEDAPRDILTRDYLPGFARRPIGRLLERVENFAARRFSALVAATPAIGARFRALNPRTVVVNNYPLRDELLPPEEIPWARRAPSVAYVGGIAPERGLYQMVEAMAYLPAHLTATLELAGTFSPQECRVEAARLRGWECVEELGVLSRLEVARLLSQVSAGLVIYLPAPNHVEAMPNKLFEYMSAGIPIVASDFPLWRGIIEDVRCGLLVDPLDSRAIARAIEYLLTHPAEAEAMGRRGRKAVEQCYNWEGEGSKLLQLYTELLEPTSAKRQAGSR